MILRSVLVMILAQAVGLAIHLGILELLEMPLFDHKIISAYILNTILASVLMCVLLLAKGKLQNNLGYLFLIGSVLKLVLYFGVFSPGFKADGELTRPEFMSFFIPYSIGLIVETGALVKRLNQQS